MTESCVGDSVARLEGAAEGLLVGSIVALMVVSGVGLLVGLGVGGWVIGALEGGELFISSSSTLIGSSSVNKFQWSSSFVVILVTLALLVTDTLAVGVIAARTLVKLMRASDISLAVLFELPVRSESTLGAEVEADVGAKVGSKSKGSCVILLQTHKMSGKALSLSHKSHL